MRVKVERKTLQSALKKLLKTADYKGDIPVLSCVLLEAGKGTATLTTTSLEVTCRVELPAKLEGDGSLLLPIKKLERIISRTKSKQVALEVGKEKEDGVRQIIVDTGKTVFTLEESFPTEEFPEIDRSFKPLLSIGSEVFNSIIRKLSSFTYKDQGRRILTFIKLEATKDALYFVATDGHVLGWYRVEWEEPPEREFHLLIHRKAFPLIRQFTANSNSVEIGVNDENDGVLRAGNNYLLWRQEESEYPDWKAVIPESHLYRATFGRDSVLEAVGELIVIFDRRDFPAGRFSFSPEGLLITATNGKEKATSKLSINYSSESHQQLGFNLEDMTTVLKSFSAETIDIQFSSSRSPAMFSSSEEPEFKVLMMPIEV